MKRSKLKPRSDKLAARMRRVKPMYSARFAEHPICEVPGCDEAATEPHHHTWKRRAGDGLFQFRCTCWACHIFIHESPDQSKRKGLLDCLTGEDWGKPNGGQPQTA